MLFKKKKIIIFILSILYPFFLFSANPSHLKKFKNTGVCKRCDLERADFQGANLKGSNLGGSNLKYSDLSLTNLENVNLGGANLTGANLDRAFMNETILCNTIMPNGFIQYSGCILPTLKQVLNALKID